jgi:predicted RecA/RadA family phage recombinase
MKNYVQKGENITVTAAAAASSGDIVKIGSMIGIAAADAAIGDDLDLATTGVFELPKVSTDVLAVGDTVYFKSADGNVTSTASGNTKMGVAVTAAGNPSGTVNVRLNGTF